MAKKKAAKKVPPRQKRRVRQPAPKARQDPNGLDNLTLPAAAAALSPEGQPATTPAMLRRDQAAGVPVARDGTWSLSAYAAWLVTRPGAAT